MIIREKEAEAEAEEEEEEEEKNELPEPNSQSHPRNRKEKPGKLLPIRTHKKEEAGEEEKMPQDRHFDTRK